jgi:hypothetical protein
MAITFSKDFDKDVDALTTKRWQARRVSNPQPAVLETAALPIELLTCTLELKMMPRF